MSSREASARRWVTAWVFVLIIVGGDLMLMGTLGVGTDGVPGSALITAGVVVVGGLAMAAFGLRVIRRNGVRFDAHERVADGPDVRRHSCRALSLN